MESAPTRACPVSQIAELVITGLNHEGAGVGRFVFISSPSVAHAGRALVGAPAGEADPESARGPYARSKAIAERLALRADRAGFAVTALRPAGMATATWVLALICASDAAMSKDEFTR